jgi:hypothetical protein
MRSPFVLKVLQAPLCIVIGTTEGEASATTRILKMHALRIANTLFAQGHFSVTIHTDREVLRSPASFARLNMVIIGSPAHNLLAERLLPTAEQLEQQAQFGQGGGGGGNFFFSHCTGARSLQYSSSGAAGAKTGFRLGPYDVGEDEAGVGVLLFGACNTSSFLGLPSTTGSSSGGSASIPPPPNAAFVNYSPLGLFVLLAGTDIEGVGLACELFPTGSTRGSSDAVPDFIFAGPETSWKGAGG